MERKNLTGRSAFQIAGCEVRNRDGHARSCVSESALHILHRGSVCRFSRDDYERRPTRSAKGLAPRPGGKKSRPPHPCIGAHEQNIGIPPSPAVLKRVIEDDDIHALRDCLTDPAHAIGNRDDGDSLVESLVHDCLVTPVTAKDDRWSGAFLQESASEPRGNGRLAGCLLYTSDAADDLLC